MGSPQPVKGSGKHARAPTASPISPSQPPRLKITAGFCGRPAPPSETARSAGGATADVGLLFLGACGAIRRAKPSSSLHRHLRESGDPVLTTVDSRLRGNDVSSAGGATADVGLLFLGACGAIRRAKPSSSLHRHLRESGDPVLTTVDSRLRGNDVSSAGGVGLSFFLLALILGLGVEIAG